MIKLFLRIALSSAALFAAVNANATTINVSFTGPDPLGGNVTAIWSYDTSQQAYYSFDFNGDDYYGAGPFASTYASYHGLGDLTVTSDHGISTFHSGEWNLYVFHAQQGPNIENFSDRIDVATSKDGNNFGISMYGSLTHDDFSSTSLASSFSPRYSLFNVIDSAGYRNGGAGGIATFVNAGVPEPATWGTLMLGFAGLGYAMRRKNKVAARIKLTEAVPATG